MSDATQLGATIVRTASYTDSERGMRGGTGYLNQPCDAEFANVEVLHSGNFTRVVVALRPPRPSSEFRVADSVVEDSSTDAMVAAVRDDIRKHASELRWNCIETMLRADIEADRLDRMRMVQFLEQTLDNETREWLATKLMERVERVPR